MRRVRFVPSPTGSLFRNVLTAVANPAFGDWLLPRKGALRRIHAAL